MMRVRVDWDGFRHHDKGVEGLWAWVTATKQGYRCAWNSVSDQDRHKQPDDEVGVAGMGPGCRMRYGLVWKGPGGLIRVQVGQDGLRQPNESVEGLGCVIATKQGYRQIWKGVCG